MKCSLHPAVPRCWHPRQLPNLHWTLGCRKQSSSFAMVAHTAKMNYFCRNNLQALRWLHRLLKRCTKFRAAVSASSFPERGRGNSFLTQNPGRVGGESVCRIWTECAVTRNQGLKTVATTIAATILSDIFISSQNVHLTVVGRHALWPLERAPVSDLSDRPLRRSSCRGPVRWRIRSLCSSRSPESVEMLRDFVTQATTT